MAGAPFHVRVFLAGVVGTAWAPVRIFWFWSVVLPGRCIVRRDDSGIVCLLRLRSATAFKQIVCKSRDASMRGSSSEALPFAVHRTTLVGLLPASRRAIFLQAIKTGIVAANNGCRTTESKSDCRRFGHLLECCRQLSSTYSRRGSQLATIVHVFPRHAGQLAIVTGSRALHTTIPQFNRKPSDLQRKDDIFQFSFFPSFRAGYLPEKYFPQAIGLFTRCDGGISSTGDSRL